MSPAAYIQTLDRCRRRWRRLTAGRGSSSVVWAGVGRRSAGVGEGEMAVIREAVVDSRAERLRISRLRSIKPYSAHGW